MSKRCVSALVKTLIFLAIVHVIMIILGLLFGTQVGWFGISMIWPHWNTFYSSVVAVVGVIIVYLIAYFGFTRDAS